MSMDLDGAIAQIGHADSIDRLRGSLQNAISHTVFTHFCFMSRLPESPARQRFEVLCGMPEGWGPAYNKVCDSDPLIRDAEGEDHPRLWRSAQHGAEESAFTAVLQQFGLDCVYMVPTRGTHYSSGLLMLYGCTGNTAPTLEHDSRLQAQVSWMAQQTLRAVKRSGVAAKTPPRLSPREIDCLRWAAEGKTSWETGRILGIAESTVTHHLKHATSKLGVPKRQAAIVRAMSLGLLDTTWVGSLHQHLADE